MIDRTDPHLVMPLDDEAAEEDDFRARLCLPLTGPADRIVAMVCDVTAEREAIVRQHQARFVELSQIERGILEDINERLPASAHVAPFSLLPPAIWETDLEARLMSWGLVPVHPYLNLYLPMSEGGNPVLHLPAAPQTYPDSYTEGALAQVQRICAHYERQRGAPPEKAASAETLEAWLEGEEEARLDAVEEILMLAEFLARRLLGNEIVERHEGLFGAVVKRAMGFPSGLLMERV